MECSGHRFPVKERVSLHVRVHGAGPGVLLLHGGGQTGDSWGATARILAQAGYEVRVPDHRGHGLSDRDPDGDYTVDAFVLDAERLVRAFGAPPVVVGASLGGVAALLLAERPDPPPMRALVLVDIALRALPAGVDRFVGFMRSTVDGFESLAAARAALRQYLPHRRQVSRGGLSRVLRKDSDGHLRWHWDPRLLDALDTAEISAGTRLRDAAARIRVPTLLVRGGNSDVVSTALAQELIDCVPHASFVDVAGATHMIAGDDNDAFTDALREFLARLP